MLNPARSLAHYAGLIAVRVERPIMAWNSIAFIRFSAAAYDDFIRISLPAFLPRNFAAHRCAKVDLGGLR